jgi:hypothetical protein
MRIYGENDRLIDAIVEVAWTTHARATPPSAIVDPIVGAAGSRGRPARWAWEVLRSPES